METLTRAQVIELFHIAFLELLSKRLDPARYVLKGGANLRYFFGSVRYSEDIDLDRHGGISEHLIKEKVEGILSAPPLSILMRTRGIAVVEHSNPKQTGTTQRWKVAVRAPGHEEPVRTKVEFSGRDGEGEFSLDAVPGEIVAPYALPRPRVQHYVNDAPTVQKVLALAGRNQTQARDVFDLELLLRRRALLKGAVDAEVLMQAADRALELDYGAFRDQVLPFLEPEAAELYEGEDSWERTQTSVAEQLEEAR